MNYAVADVRFEAVIRDPSLLTWPILAPQLPVSSQELMSTRRHRLPIKRRRCAQSRCVRSCTAHDANLAASAGVHGITVATRNGLQAHRPDQVPVGVRNVEADFRSGKPAVIVDCLSLF
jgi:hypothetical protein